MRPRVSSAPRFAQRRAATRRKSTLHGANRSPAAALALRTHRKGSPIELLHRPIERHDAPQPARALHPIEPNPNSRTTMTLRRRASLSTLLALSAAWAPSAWAQSSESAIEAEIAFARGLARDWAFVDLAQGVLADVAKQRPSERMAEQVELVRCELFAIGAKQLDDPTAANAMFEQGYEALNDYIDSNPDAANRGDAEASLVSLSEDYAASIDAALEEAAGEEAETLRSRKTELIEDAIARTETLIEELSNISERNSDQNFKRWTLMLSKGDLYAEMAKTLGGDINFSEGAITAYEELSLDAGFGTEFDLRANVGLGTVEEAQGNHADAAEYFMGMIDQVLPLDPEERESMLTWSEVPRDIREKRFNYVELGIPGVQRASRAVGDYGQALKYGLFLYNLYREEGFNLSILGHAALLEVAETLVETGGFIGGDLGAGAAKHYATEADMKKEVKRRRDQRGAVEFALQLVNQVAEETPVPATKIKAGRLLEAINTRPDIEISANQLLEAAKAKRLAEEYDASLDGYYAVLQRMDTMEEADRRAFGAEVYAGIGACLRAQGRMWEAGMAYLEGVENWSDPEWNLRNARGMKASITTYARELGIDGDAAIQRLLAQADNLIVENSAGEGVDVITFNQGKKALDREDYDGALEKLGQIEPGQSPYDAAQVLIGEALLKSGKVSDAVRHWTKYVDEFAKDPANEPQSPSLKDSREQGVSRSIYYVANVLKKAADRTFAKDGSTARYAQVIARIENFHSEFSGQAKLVPVIEAMLVDAYAKTGQVDKASETVARLTADYKESRFTAAAAIDLYRTYDAQRKALLEASERDADAIAGVTSSMATALQVANEISADPSYGNLNAEANLWLELEDWAKARAGFERVIGKFKDDAKYGERVVKFGVVNLAEVLLEMGEATEAKALLEPYVFGDGAVLKTTRPVVLTATAMIGSVVGSGTQVKQTPGAGGTDEQFDYVTKRLDSLVKQLDKWSGEWYEAKFTSAYAYYVWGQRDDRKKPFAKAIVDNIVTFAEGDTQFTQVDEAIADSESERLKRRSGGGVLASRFRWLYGKTR